MPISPGRSPHEKATPNWSQYWMRFTEKFSWLSPKPSTDHHLNTNRWMCDYPVQPCQLKFHLKLWVLWIILNILNIQWNFHFILCWNLDLLLPLVMVSTRCLEFVAPSSTSKIHFGPIGESNLDSSLKQFLNIFRLWSRRIFWAITN